MKRTAFSTRDQAIANDSCPVGYTPDQMCAADRCPNRWAIQSSKCCHWHHGADVMQWPRITAEHRDAETDRILARQNHVPLVVPKLTRQEKLAILAKLRNLFTGPPADPKAWAYALQERERNGEPLSIAQRTAWRETLREADLLPEGSFQSIKPEALPPALRPDWIDPDLCADLEASTRDMLYAYRHRQQQLAAEGRA